jgi:hypothetical protein
MQDINKIRISFDAAILSTEKAPNQKRVLKAKLKYIKLEKGESISSFFSKISQIRDQLLVVGVKVDDDDLVQAVFDGLPSSWEVSYLGYSCEVEIVSILSPASSHS